MHINDIYSREILPTLTMKCIPVSLSRSTDIDNAYTACTALCILCNTWLYCIYRQSSKYMYFCTRLGVDKLTHLKTLLAHGLTFHSAPLNNVSKHWKQVFYNSENICSH